MQERYDLEFPKLPIPSTARRIYNPDAHCIITNFHSPGKQEEHTSFKDFLKRKGIQHMLNGMPLIICKLYEKQFLQRMCIWNDESITETFHERIKYSIGRGAYNNSIIRIKRIIQRNKAQIQYDVYTDKYDNPSIIKNLFIRGRKTFDWHVKLHVPWEERIEIRRRNAQHIAPNLGTHPHKDNIYTSHTPNTKKTSPTPHHYHPRLKHYQPPDLQENHHHSNKIRL